MLYALDSDEGRKHERALRLLTAGRAAGASITIQAMCEVFSVLTTRKRYARAKARALIARLSESLRVIEPKTHDVLRAARLSEAHGLSIWAATMVCVSAGGGCTSLVTEDLQSGRRFSEADAGRSIVIVNPFDDANLARLVLEGLTPS